MTLSTRHTLNKATREIGGQIDTQQSRNGTCHSAKASRLSYMNTAGIPNVIKLRLVMVSIFVVMSVLLAPRGLNAETDNRDACLEPKIDWRNYQWTLITGHGVEACEEMFEYVKSRPADQPPPTCPEDRLPPNGNWTRPESRILNQAEKQAILDGIPVDKPWVKRLYEPFLRKAKVMRVIKADITGDGKPEMLLAYSDYDYRQACKRSIRCAEENKVFKNAYKYTIRLMSDSANLLPMTNDGKQVDWNHMTVAFNSMPKIGELIYFKGLPYWLSLVIWDQAAHDDFRHSRIRPNDPYSAIFTLVRVSSYSRQKPQSKTFEDVTDMSPLILDPLKKDYCRFGFFNKENLRLNSKP